MKKIYDANGENKRGIIELENILKAFDLALCGYDTVLISDMIILAQIEYKKDLFTSKEIDTTWTINGLKMPYSENNNKK